MSYFVAVPEFPSLPEAVHLNTIESVVLSNTRRSSTEAGGPESTGLTASSAHPPIGRSGNSKTRKRRVFRIGRKIRIITASYTFLRKWLTFTIIVPISHVPTKRQLPSQVFDIRSIADPQYNGLAIALTDCVEELFLLCVGLHRDRRCF